MRIDELHDKSRSPDAMIMAKFISYHEKDKYIEILYNDGGFSKLDIIIINVLDNPKFSFLLHLSRSIRFTSPVETLFYNISFTFINLKERHWIILKTSHHCTSPIYCTDFLSLNYFIRQ